MSDIVQDFPIDVGSSKYPITLRLRHCAGVPGDKGAVLMLHGGNTGSDTFRHPEGGLARYLGVRGWDVWLLDWRSSPHVLEGVLKGGPLGGSADSERRMFTLDSVVTEDLPAAVRKVRKEIGRTAPLSIIGHCLGAGALSLAVARGTLEGDDYGVTGIVLSTLGLFYEVPWNGWIKSEDFILERVLGGTDAECRQIDPNHPEAWPEDVKDAYNYWPPRWLPTGESRADELLRRLAFMIGQPYARERLHRSITDDLLLTQFGPLHLGFYLHMSQNVRRGYAAPFDTLDVIDRPRTERAAACNGQPAPAQTSPPSQDLRADHFLDKRVTLIAAAENQVWHRDAIDLMYEWLLGSRDPGRPFDCSKHVLPGYRIQELFWGADAEHDVYERVIAPALTFDDAG